MSNQAETTSALSKSCCNPCRGDQRPSAFQRHLLIGRNNNDAEDVEATLVQGMKDLSFDQLQREQEDFHGVANTSSGQEHNPDYIGEKLQSLNAHLTRIKAGTIYESAEAKDLAYVSNRVFRIDFLKGNRYDPKAAAEQMIRYFDVKHNLFGDECLVRDITAEDLTKDDIANLLCGTLQISSCPDGSGRPILMGLPGIIANVPLRNILRSIFFVCLELIASMADRTKGIVVVSYQIGKYRDMDVYKEGNYEGTQMGLSLPVNIAGCHFCFDDPSQCIIARAAVGLLPSYLRAKTRIHFGTHFECQYLLSTYGIPREALPFHHPSNELDLTYHKYWFEQCQHKDRRKLLSEASLSSTKQSSKKNIEFLSSRWQGETTPMDDDVLCVGRKVNGKGNERYMALAVLHQDAFVNGSPKEKSIIIDTIMEEVKKYGRFLKLDTSESGGWVEVPDKEMRLKIGTTFRNLKYRRAASQQAKAKAKLDSSGNATASALIVDQYTPQDILFGGRMKNHVGNQRLRELVQNVATEYDASNRGKKLQIAQQLMERITNEGGRFLKPRDDGRWEVVSGQHAVTKVGAHFRNLRRKQWR